MISIPISPKISGGTAPYGFTFSSNNSSCVSFSAVTGKAEATLTSGTYVANTNVQYSNQSCIDNSIIIVTFTDVNGCSISDVVVVNNPCNLTNSISFNGDFVFTSTVTGGTGDYTFQWNYDTTLFSLSNSDTSSTDNYLSLALTNKPVPTSTLIECIVTDSNGCTMSASYIHSFCKPSIALSRRVGLVCDSTPLSGCSLSLASQYRNLNIASDVIPCSGQTIDWTTAVFTVPVGVCVVHHGNGLISIGSSITSASTKNITYTVKTTTGITSNTGTITVTIPECAVVQKSFSGVPTTIQLVAGDIIGTVKTIPVEPRVFGNPNWSSFVFTNTPNWGTVAFNADREITYTITNILTTPTVPDVIKWSLQDTMGNQINITDTVLRDIIAVPSTVTETVCAACGSTSGPIDVLANDTGDIDRSTLTITLNDPDILITKDTDNNLIFSASPGASFANLNRYKVANTQGAYSAEQGFFVQVACAGDNPLPTKDLTCSVSKSFDLLDQFSNYNAFNVTYLETTTGTTYASQGGTITGADGTVNFAAISTGTYTFEVTFENVAACSPAFDSIGTVTVIHGATPSLSFTSVVDNGDGTITCQASYVNILVPITVTLNGSPANFQATPNHVGGNVTFTLYGTTGLQTIVISAGTICATNVNDTDASITL